MYTLSVTEETSYIFSENPNGAPEGRTRTHVLSFACVDTLCIYLHVYMCETVYMFPVMFDVGTRAVAYLYELSWRRLKWSEPYLAIHLHPYDAMMTFPLSLSRQPDPLWLSATNYREPAHSRRRYGRGMIQCRSVIDFEPSDFRD